MSKITVGAYEGSIYREGAGWTVALSLGFKPDGTRNRIKRKGRTRAEAKDRIKQAVADMEKGVKRDHGYTVARAVKDLIETLAAGGLSESTIVGYRSYAANHISKIGAVKVADLTPDQVEKWLMTLRGTMASRTLGMIHGLLTRALDRAARFDKVDRNVSRLVATPKGMSKGRPSKSMTLDQAKAVLAEAAKPEHRFGPYAILAITTGLRTEELRALTWDDVDLTTGTVYVVRSDRQGGDTKTEKSRRGLGIAQTAVSALTAHKARQAGEKLIAGEAWQNNGLVFARPDGSGYRSQTAAYHFRKVLAAAGLNPDEWTPRETRHCFVSIMSDQEVQIEVIADLCGHASPAVTNEVYRHQLKPVRRDATAHMDRIFGAA
ncbi:site-specific integrase [Actinocorallia longicatena]|uniref:Site-specific integrase n=1 Tax=Actinocorallia longicatena TaxID=111803 RepID=A0ABP6QJP0_9ACTN